MRKIAAYTSALLALVLIAFSITGFGSGASSNEGYKVGDIVEDFSLPNVDGKDLALSSIANAKGIVVVFTCNHCPYSVLYEDRLIALDGEFKAKGFPVVAINPNDEKVVPEDSFENMKARAQEKGFTFPYLHDATQEIAKRFGAARTPHCFLLSKDGARWKVAYIGAIDDNAKEPSAVKTTYLAQAITAVSAGQKPTPDFTKAVGCSIKWAKKD